MDVATIITTIAGVITTAVKVGPTVIKTLQDAEPFAKAIYDNLVGGAGEITQADLDALEAQITDLSNQLQQPLPPE